MNNELLWKWQIWLYLWAAGVAGGGYFIAYLINIFTGFKEERLVKYSTYIGVPFVAFGTFMLLIDLGKVERFWHLMVRFYYHSPMSIGTWVLTLWILCGIFLICLWNYKYFIGIIPFIKIFKRFEHLKTLAEGVNFILSPILIAYTGVLLSCTSLPVWKSYFLPPLFVISACSTGLAGILFALILKKEEISHVMGQTSVLLSMFEAITLVLFLLSVPSYIIVKGALSFAFWGGVVVVALFIPLWLKLWNLGQVKENATLLMVAAWWILIGGIILRAIIVIGGQVSI
jgi:formate-dependent nitrite reductase membrane component NrfD